MTLERLIAQARARGYVVVPTDLADQIERVGQALNAGEITVDQLQDLAARAAEWVVTREPELR